MKCSFPQYILFTCLVFIVSCDDSGIGNKQSEFYYYPSKNVYYDVENHEYAYSINGGKTWTKFKSNNNTEPATLGSKQVIYTSNNQPWLLNAEHRKTYNGKLIAVTTEDTGITQANLVSEKKIVSKKPKLNVNEPPQEEKKPGFFKRLFGGKKHNNQ